MQLFLCLDTLVGVYAFGFLFMLPQLFVNYKVHIYKSTSLVPRFGNEATYSQPCADMPIRITIVDFYLPQLKSVAHLPWRAFMYKASIGAIIVTHSSSSIIVTHSIM